MRPNAFLPEGPFPSAKFKFTPPFGAFSLIILSPGKLPLCAPPCARQAGLSERGFPPGRPERLSISALGRDVLPMFFFLRCVSASFLSTSLARFFSPFRHLCRPLSLKDIGQHRVFTRWGGGPIFLIFAANFQHLPTTPPPTFPNAIFPPPPAQAPPSFQLTSPFQRLPTHGTQV